MFRKSPDHKVKPLEPDLDWRGGPVTARNAYTGGHWRQERELLKALRRALREQREALRRR